MILETMRVGEGGRPALLLHGFLGSGRNLRSLAVRWSQRDPSKRFLLPDLTGHGASQPLPEDATLTSIAGDVLETAAKEGVTDPVWIVGHSFGGRVALAAARAHPERVSGVTLLDIGPSPIVTDVSESGRVLDLALEAPDSTPDRASMRQFLMGRGLSPALSDWLLTNLVPGEGGALVWRFDRAGLQRLHRRVNTEDLWDVIEAKRVPVRCIRGSRSKYVSDADVKRLEANGCPVETLEAGHFIHVDALEPLVRQLEAREP